MKSDTTMDLIAILDDLARETAPLRFEAPVTHVYNPLVYARKPHEAYLKRYGAGPREVILLGMNPGPWGMAQTGVPFGEVDMVRRWLEIGGEVAAPEAPHPKRPVMGFECRRSEVSGRRLWGWAEKRFKTPEAFFSRFFVANYCPLVFMEESGKNKTPDTLRASEQGPLFDACDRALRRTVEYFSPRIVLGVGAFARKRAEKALTGLPVVIKSITHPSPANPKANRGWETIMEAELKEMGIL